MLNNTLSLGEATGVNKFITFISTNLVTLKMLN